MLTNSGVCFLITTYNRQQSCQKLVDTLHGQGDIVVLNDGCCYEIKNCKQYFLINHNGRRGYWKTVKALFKFAKGYKYYFMIPDDFLPKDNMVEEALNIWNKIDDKAKICLNLYADRVGMSCWTIFNPKNKGYVWHTQWVDMCFMAEQRFFDAIDLQLVRANTRSSGVGAQISRQLNKAKYNLYQVKESLVIPQEEHYKSQMHDKENIPWDSKRSTKERFIKTSSELRNKPS